MPADHSTPEGRRIDLPGALEESIVDYANPEGIGPRADDLMIHLYAADKTYLGTLTLGWFRDHTSVADGEASLRSTGVE